MNRKVSSIFYKGRKQGEKQEKNRDIFEELKKRTSSTILLRHFFLQFINHINTTNIVRLSL